MNETKIAESMDYLARIDPDIKHALPNVGPPPPRIRPVGFETFFTTIVSQQISTAAASAIMARVRVRLPSLTAETVLLTPPEALREDGLSYRKIEYAKDLANAITEGTFSINALKQLDDQTAIDQITTLRGFGRWSAEIYLMFSLQRQDIFPADDLAIQIGLQKLKNLDDKPSAKTARQLTEHWAPQRSTGALFLWHYYHGAPN